MKAEVTTTGRNRVGIGIQYILTGQECLEGNQSISRIKFLAFEFSVKLQFEYRSQVAEMVVLANGVRALGIDGLNIVAEGVVEVLSDLLFRRVDKIIIIG